MAKPMNRPERVPVFKQKGTVFATKEGFYRRGVIDSPERIEQLKRAGYVIVQDAEVNDESDERVQNASPMGSAVTRPANKDPNAPFKKYVLMELPQEYRDEDLEAKNQRNREDEESINPNHVRGDGTMYGEFKKTKE